MFIYTNRGKFCLFLYIHFIYILNHKQNICAILAYMEKWIWITYIYKTSTIYIAYYIAVNTEYIVRKKHKQSTYMTINFMSPNKKKHSIVSSRWKCASPSHNTKFIIKFYMMQTNNPSCIYEIFYIYYY